MMSHAQLQTLCLVCRMNVDQAVRTCPAATIPYPHIQLQQDSVVCLQVGGFLQRIDYVRKHAFGVMCILKVS